MLDQKSLNINSAGNILEDLDQYIISNIPTNPKATEAEDKSKLLDRSIQVDLPAASLPTAVEPGSAVTTDLANTVDELVVSESETKNLSIYRPSAHLLDLRLLKKTPPSQLAIYAGIWLDRWQQWRADRAFNAKLKAKPEPLSTYSPLINIAEEAPSQKSGLGLIIKGASLARSAVVFALITTLVLMPVRGLVFFGQISKDRANIIRYGQSGFLNLHSGVLSAAENSYDLAQADLAQALTDFRQAQSSLNVYNDWLIEFSSLIPILGKQLSLGKNILSASANISEAAAIINQKLQSDAKPTEYLVFISSQIAKTIPYLEETNQSLTDVSLDSLPTDWQTPVAELQQELPTLLEDLHAAQKLFPILADFLGHNQEKRYLVLFQNNNELRATGGFIGSFALFDVYRGEVKHLEVPSGGTYDLDYNPGPKIKAPTALSLINPYFNIWDANWWPDFPTSAGKIVDLYQETGGSSLDGVVAINSEVLRELLVLLGPVAMPDYGLEIRADNLYQVLQAEIELSADPRAPKAVISDLVPLVLEKLLSLGAGQKDLASTFFNMLAAKHIQLFSTDPGLQDSLENLTWSGRLLDNDKDFLAVVNTNIAGGKTDNHISQLIDHQAEILNNGEIINTVRITRTNNDVINNPFAGIEGGNVSYLRFFVPVGSEFIEAIGFDRMPDEYFQAASLKNYRQDPDLDREEDSKFLDAVSGTEIYQSLDKTVLANWLLLKPGESKTVSVKYKLPFRLNLGDKLVDDWWQIIFKKGVYLDNYSLLVWKQPGNQNTTINSSVIIPDNLKVVWYDASHVSAVNTTEKLVTYNHALESDEYYGLIMTNR